MKVSRGVMAVAMLSLAVPVCAQSLGELAKREQERRKATPPAAKVYTDDDLRYVYTISDVAAIRARLENAIDVIESSAVVITGVPLAQFLNDHARGSR